MRILTFDTSSDSMYITIGNDSQIDSYKILENTKERFHSALLIPIIIELLKEAKLTMQDIDAIGINVGPGSFTGLRVSATVARVISQNLDIPAVGVPSLEIISMINKSEKNALCLLDARKSKVYAGIYTPDGIPVKNPSAISLEEMFDLVKNNDFFVIADNSISNILKAEGFESLNLSEIKHNFGIELAKLTFRHLQQDGTENYKWFNLKPLYIQPPPISMPKTAKL